MRGGAARRDVSAADFLTRRRVCGWRMSGRSGMRSLMLRLSSLRERNDWSDSDDAQRSIEIFHVVFLIDVSSVLSLSIHALCMRTVRFFTSLMTKNS